MPDPVIMQGIGQQEEQQRRQQRRQPLRQHTPTQSTTFLVVSRRDGGGRCTGLITGGADIAVQTAAVTHASTTSISGYEQRYSTQAAATVAETENKPPSEKPTGLAIGLAAGVPALLLFGVLLYLYHRRRRRVIGRPPGSRSGAFPVKASKSSINSSWQSQSITSAAPSRRSNPSPNQPPPVWPSAAEESGHGNGGGGGGGGSLERTDSSQQIPQRSGARTPVAELETPTTTNPNHLSSVFAFRRPALPPLPRLKIERNDARQFSAPFRQMPRTHDALVSSSTTTTTTATTRAPPTRFSRRTVSDGSSTSRAPLIVSPFTPVTPGPGPGLYGHQSEYPEVLDGPRPGPARPSKAAAAAAVAAVVVGDAAEREREMQFLAEEERLIKQRVRAAEELIRLKKEEARIFNRKKQLGLGR